MNKSIYLLIVSVIVILFSLLLAKNVIAQEPVNYAEYQPIVVGNEVYYGITFALEGKVARWVFDGVEYIQFNESGAMIIRDTSNVNQTPYLEVDGKEIDIIEKLETYVPIIETDNDGVYNYHIYAEYDTEFCIEFIVEEGLSLICMSAIEESVYEEEIESRERQQIRIKVDGKWYTPKRMATGNKPIEITDKIFMPIVSSQQSSGE